MNLCEVFRMKKFYVSEKNLKNMPESTKSDGRGKSEWTLEKSPVFLRYILIRGTMVLMFMI